LPLLADFREIYIRNSAFFFYNCQYREIFHSFHDQGKKMANYSNLTVLIVDPNVGMRGNLHNMLNSCEINKIEYAVSAGTAIRHIRKQSFDVILCEYDLGNGQEGQDGQQLLEDLRNNKLIALWTIFIMITSENVLAKVMGAAELAPTDYILKPFTRDMLLQRITKALEKRADFFSIHNAMTQGNLREAIRICILGETKVPRHVNEFLRLRAELHLSLGEAEEAEQLYRKIIEGKALHSAQLGLAKALYMQQRYDETDEVLNQLISGNDKIMSAYDLLAKNHQAMGNMSQAQQTLETAVSKSPHMVRRLRRLGEIALESGDVGVAERSFKQVVAKAKYSEFRDPEDHVKLVQTLIKKGDPTGAAGVIRDMEKSLRGIAKMDACRALSTAMLYDATGNAKSAKEEVNNAATAVQKDVILSSQMMITLTNNCLSHQLDEAASNVMLCAMNDNDSDVTIIEAMAVFEKAGRLDLAKGMNMQVKKQVEELVASSEEKAKLGEHKAAVAAMMAAVHKIPGNTQLLYGTVTTILRNIDVVGWDPTLGEQAHIFIEKIRALDANNPLLPSLLKEYQNIQRKYGIAA
jgi:CheY-like chemotaxis protein